MFTLEYFTTGRWRWFWRLLPVLETVALLVLYRGAHRYAAPDFGGPEPFENHRAAMEILDHGTTAMTFHATGYSYLVALAYLLLPRTPNSMLMVQGVMLVPTVWAIEQLALKFGGERVRQISLVLAGLYYPFAYYAATFTSVFPAAVFATLACAFVLPLLEKWDLKYALACGASLGVAVCCRPNLGGLGVVFVIAIFLASRSVTQTLLRAAPIGVLSLLFLATMTFFNPPEPGQFVRGSQAMNRSLLEGTYQFEDRWWDWEALNDPKVIAPFWDHAHRLEAESGKPLEDPATQLLARRDAWARMKANPAGVVKKAAISSVRLWIFMPSHSKSMAVKVLITVQEALLLLLALFGLRTMFREKKPWVLATGVLLIPTLTHILMHVEARYSLPGRGVEVALMAVGIAALLPSRVKKPAEAAVVQPAEVVQAP